MTDRAEPWTLAQTGALLGCQLASVAAAVVAWFGARSETNADDQLLWVQLGVAAVGLAAIANGLWLLAGRRAVGQARHQIAVDELVRTGVISAQFDPLPLVSSPSMTRYHRPDCVLVQRKPVRAWSPSKRGLRHRQPCDVCLPEEPSA